jgi:hypothetical protein
MYLCLSVSLDLSQFPIVAAISEAITALETDPELKVPSATAAASQTTEASQSTPEEFESLHASNLRH